MWPFGKKRRARKEAEKLQAEEKAKQEAKLLKEKETKADSQKDKPKASERKIEPKKVVKTEEVAEDDDETKDEKSSTKVPKYHVSQNKDTNSEFYKKWRVRKEGSQKTIKFYDTQLEAINAAKDLAEKAGSSVVIHKLDGSIRKQDYTKK